MIPLLVGFTAGSAGYPVVAYYGNSECYSIDKQIITTHEIIAKPLESKRLQREFRRSKWNLLSTKTDYLS